MEALVSLIATGAGDGGFSWVGVVVPAITFTFSFAVTWWLYRHFRSK